MLTFDLLKRTARNDSDPDKTTTQDLKTGLIRVYTICLLVLLYVALILYLRPIFMPPPIRRIAEGH